MRSSWRMKHCFGALRPAWGRHSSYPFLPVMRPCDRCAQEPQRFLRFLDHPIDDRAGKCPLDHPQGTEHEIRFVEIWISAAVGRARYPPVISEERRI